MNKIKLEVIRINEDVIATSCESVWGVARFMDNDPEIHMSSAYRNGTNNSNRHESGRKLENKNCEGVPVGFTTTGWYHIDSKGNIIERCPYEDVDDVNNHHHIDLDR